MKKHILIFALILLNAFCAFSANKMRFYLSGKLHGFYVDSKEGLNVRSEPSLSAKKIATLLDSDYVIPVEIGEKATIDGTEDYWVKILLYPEHRKDKKKDEYGWVFGAYLDDAFPSFYAAELKKQIKQRGFNHFPDFCDDEETNYMIYDEDDEFAKWAFKYSQYSVGSWRDKYPYYNRALPNYFATRETSNVFNYFAKSEARNVFALTVREAFFLDTDTDGKSAENPRYHTIKLLPPFTRVGLLGICGWGIELETKTLYPIYSALVNNRAGKIRGIDIANIYDSSHAFISEEKGLNFVYQTAYTNVRTDENGGVGFHKEEFEKVLSDKKTYDLAFLNGTTEISAMCFKDKDKKCYCLSPKDLAQKNGFLRILCPKNLATANPPAILEQIAVGDFNEKKRTINQSTTLYSLKTSGDEAKAKEICTYSITTSDNSRKAPKGIANHFFVADSKHYADALYVYEYQTDESGKVTKNETRIFEDKDYDNTFRFVKKCVGEPKPERPSGEPDFFVNPICRLKMRAEPNLDALVFGTLDAGTLLKIVDVDDNNWVVIDGIKGKWLKVEAVNDEHFVEGGEVSTGWVFGGYVM